ncbi:glycoside hydrolase family 28 protein [uncultured Formosa sp.]|uniref:glycoside hydrolase family 28 protein n=1 Tax=uncultured Formosa sp. TaxID=255435 RepID=UPI00262B2B1B|nr:glycoside hydrolase family 28 protein [uncultured Formosa sp.]
MKMDKTIKINLCTGGVLKKNNFLFLYVVLISAIACKGQNELVAWQLADHLTETVKEPVFRNVEYNILDFGAKSNDEILDTQAFKDAIKKCTIDGGGYVIVPEGLFLSGPIHLDDNVNLHLEKGSEIKFSNDLNDYYPLVHTSFEGNEYINYSPLIYARGKKNIAITGKGVLNGNANNSNWWSWCGKEIYGWEEGMDSQHVKGNRDRLVEMAEANVPVSKRVFGKGYFLRPNFIEPFECENVLIKNVKIINAPFWVIHPFKSRNIIVDGVNIVSHGPNNDGCDPEYSKNVIIKNSTFNTGDDCIAIKSGRDDEGRRVGIVSENILIQNCKMLDGHGGVVMGSEISAGVRNVFVENCEMDSPNLERAIRIKTNSKRGGFVENVYVRNLRIGQVKEAVLKINLFYGIYGEQTGDNYPKVKNINLNNIIVDDGGEYGILARGHKNYPIEDVTLSNITIKKVKKTQHLEYVNNIKLINTNINEIEKK